MFGLFKKQAPKVANRLFRLTVHIGRGSNIEIPANLIGAHVPIFVGFEFIDISDRQIHELDPTKWNAFY